LKKKTSRSIKIKINRNQKNKDQIQNKYKLEDTIEFLKARHKYQIPRERERKGGRGKKFIIVSLTKHATLANIFVI
jgi:Rieske Fe-S protein